MLRTTITLLLLSIGSHPLMAASPLEGIDPAQRPHLKSIYSTLHDLEDFRDPDQRALVLVFTGTQCPVARDYVATLNALHAKYAEQGVRILGIFSNVGTNVFDMATYAHDEDMHFPVLLDINHALADLLHVKCTPEVVVLDSKLNKVYQGAIDNQYKRHGRIGQPTENYLLDGITSALEGKSPARAYVAASGCPLERQEPKRTPREVTFYKDILPIVQSHCQTCHRTGGPAPFELESFEDIAYNTEKIREVVVDRRMPPWHGRLNPEFGKFKNDHSLSEETIATLTAWIDAGAPEGDKKDAPAPIQWPAADAWAIGKPDYVYKMPEPFHLPKSGVLEYQFFRVPLGFTEDRWFNAVEIKPGNSEVVHHVTLHVAPAQEKKSLGGFAMAQLYGLNGDKAHLINDYVPGDTYNAKVYPSHQAVLIPKNSDLIFELHYTPNNREATTDQSMVAFRWADGPPEEQVHTRVFRKPIGRFRIPPHAEHYPIQDTYYFEHDILLDAVRPHFHYRGKSFRLEMVERDPKTDEIIRRRTIVSVPIFDAAWQRTYELETPLFVPAGTELVATGHFDNSRFNPNNPNPNAEVLWGQQSYDEMFSTRFKYRIVDGTEK